MPWTEQILPLTGPMVDQVDKNMSSSEQGVVRRRLNLRPDINGSIFANPPIKGTTLIEGQQLPSGENKVLGWCHDNENEAILYFVWNENQGHSIFKLSVLTGTIQRVFYNQASLGFTADTVINACVVDGRVYWNDNTDHPKSFNIQKAINFTAGLTADAYTTSDQPFDENVFPLIKEPPRFKPDIAYESYQTDPYDNTKEIIFNNLRKKQWQFKYNYIYEDYQESAYSPTSVVLVPETEVDTTGKWTDDITLNNTIKVTVATGGSNVKSIRVAVKDASNRNSGDFYEFKKIDKFDSSGTRLIEDNIIYDVYFLNNTSLQNINTDISNAYFHDVPLVAKDMLLVDGKYLAMSMPKKGYDFDEGQLEYELSTQVNTAEFDTNSTRFNSIWEYAKDDWDQCGIKGDFRIVIKLTIPEWSANSVYSVTIQQPLPFGSTTVSYVTTAVKPADWPLPARNSLINQLTAAVDKCAAGQPVNIRPVTGNNAQIRFDYYMRVGLIIYSTTDYDVISSTNPALVPIKRMFVSLSDLSALATGVMVTSTSSPTYKGLKRGQYHPFGIVYNDGNGRYNVVFGNKELFVPLFNIDENPELEETTVSAVMTINHRPPEWAHTYRLAYIPYNSYTYCMYVPAVEVVIGTTNGVPDGYYFLKINQAILALIEQFPNTVIESYVWQNGDRIRQYGKEESYEILKEFTREYTLGDTQYIETGYLIDANLDTSGSPTRITSVEIYRPNLTPQNKVFYEIGEEYEILNPGTSIRSHAGLSQNQSSDLATPAVIETDFGDVYFRIRLSLNTTQGFILVEDNNVSDYYVSSGISIGRGVVRTDSKQATTKQVIVGENYIENTKINRLNVFLAQTESYTVSENYGDITKVLERGDTIKIIQRHRETSVYVGKSYAKDADGNNIALESTRIFGSANPYEAFAGSAYPRSVVASEKYVYFFDDINGDFYRSAVNGTSSISKEYGMNNYFDQKSASFRAYTGTKDIVVFFESNTETVWLSFITGSTIETIVFSESESSKGFLFFVELNNGTMIPENMAWYGDYTYLFSNGLTHSLGTGNDNEFLGSTRKESQIEVICNQYPHLEKSFETLDINSDGDWTIIAEIDSDNNYPFGQKTKIFSQRFQKRQGVLNAGFPMNIISRTGVEDLSKLYSGNKMTGNAIKITASSSNFEVLRNMKVKAIIQK